MVPMRAVIVMAVRIVPVMAVRIVPVMAVRIVPVIGVSVRVVAMFVVAVHDLFGIVAMFLVHHFGVVGLGHGREYRPANAARKRTHSIC